MQVENSFWLSFTDSSFVFVKNGAQATNGQRPSVILRGANHTASGGGGGKYNVNSVYIVRVSAAAPFASSCEAHRSGCTVREDCVRGRRRAVPAAHRGLAVARLVRLRLVWRQSPLLPDRSWFPQTFRFWRRCVTENAATPLLDLQVSPAVTQPYSSGVEGFKGLQDITIQDFSAADNSAPSYYQPFLAGLPAGRRGGHDKKGRPYSGLVPIVAGKRGSHPVLHQLA